MAPPASARSHPYAILLLILIFRPGGIFLPDATKEGLKMRFVFKTSYDADISAVQTSRSGRLVRVASVAFGAGHPALLRCHRGCVPAGRNHGCSDPCDCGHGVDAADRATPGLPSLGHATFMAFGCYININMLGAGVPWVIAFPLSGLIAGVLGTMIALPVLRLHGVYLALGDFGDVDADQRLCRHRRAVDGRHRRRCGA